MSYSLATNKSKCY